jgi:molybdopterin-guanine dinucleotide biosynthesis protein
MQIILISGKSNSGKGTVAEIIEEILKNQDKHIIRCSLSTYIREITKNDFFWNGIDTLESRRFMAEVYRIGTEFYPYHMARRVWERDIEPYADKDTIAIIESFREKVNYDYFVMLLNQGLIDEIITIRVTRPDFNAIKDEVMENHVSESDLDDFLFNYHIDNNSTVEKLNIKVDEFVEWLEV